ncbi:MAG: TonB-dependent receptor [Gammaproteobacteria bacterium]|nr:TonB-dependent receptor [Gammaproteobacteria bacterium]
MSRLSLAVLAALSFSLAAHAGEQPETLTVIGSRLPAGLAGANLTVLTAADWQCLPVVDLAGVLARQAGISLSSLYGNGAQTTVDLRGYGVTAGQNTLFLLNGRRLSDLDLSATDLAALPLARIQRIEILRGAGGVLYGDGASAGVINIITEQGLEPGTSGAVQIEAGSHDRNSLTAQGRWAGEDGVLALSGQRLRQGGYRDNSALTETSGSAELQRQTGSGRWLFRLEGDEQEQELPGVRKVKPGLDQLRDDRRGSATPNDFADKRATAATVGYSAELSTTLDFLADANLRRKDQEAFYDDYDFGGAYARHVQAELDYKAFTPRLAWNLDGSRHDLGLDLSRADYDSERAQRADTPPVHRLAASREAAALYGLSRFELAGGELSLGARWQRVELEARDRLDPTAPGSDFESQAAPLSDDEHATSWQLGWQQALAGGWSYYVQANRSLRFATIDELFQLGTDFSQEFSRLKAQTARHLETGLRYEGEALSASASVYAQRLENEIHFNPVEFRNQNLDPTARRGLELEARWQLAEELALRGNYGYRQARFRAGAFDGNDVPLVPKTAALLGFDWNLAADWSLAADGRYESRRRFDNDEANDFGRQIPGRTLVDLRLAYRPGDWDFSLSVNNATGRKVYDYGVRSLFSEAYNAYPLPEREWLVQAGRRF